MDGFPMWCRCPGRAQGVEFDGANRTARQDARERERQTWARHEGARVLHAIDGGRNYRWIVRDLGISKNTVANIVKRHRANPQRRISPPMDVTTPTEHEGEEREAAELPSDAHVGAWALSEACDGVDPISQLRAIHRPLLRRHVRDGHRAHRCHVRGGVQAHPVISTPPERSHADNGRCRAAVHECG